MKLRTRLTLLFTLITGLLLLLFVAIIYYSAKKDRENEFYQLLKKEAFTKANIFLNGKVDQKTLQEIYHSNRKLLNEVEVAIYDPQFHLLYHDAVDIDVVKETPEMIKKIYAKKEIKFYQKDWQVIGISYPYQGKIYIITAAAYDEYGYTKLLNLLQNCIIVFMGSMMLIFFLGRFFSEKALKPVSEITQKARVISATNLDLRIENSGNKDELSQLAHTFNDMLERLEHSFDAQKNFVSNISHELRTPLAAIISELEITASRERDINDYQAAIQRALEDAKRIVRLSNSLLDMAKAQYDPSEIVFKSLRLDELLLDARHVVQQANSSFKIDIFIDDTIETEEQLTTNGNEYLLKVAFCNLLENGCKFSEDHHVLVNIAVEKQHIILKFTDHGVGISKEDLTKIFTPFYRGTNGNLADGNGIGLPLTQRIIELHHGIIAVTSVPKSTTFSISLPLN